MAGLLALLAVNVGAAQTLTPTLRVVGTAAPWVDGATYRGRSPGAAARDLYAGRADVALVSSPLPPPPGGRRTLAVPVGVFAVRVAYRLPGVTLRLNVTTLCRLLDGTVRVWNAPEVQALQAPGVTLPALPVLVSARTDANGASFAVAQACVRAGAWPRARLKATWTGGAAFTPGSAEAQARNLDLPGALAVRGPGALPAGVGVARLRSPDGVDVPPTPALGFVGTPGARSGLPRTPFGLLPSANAPGAYPLRGLLWAVTLADQAYGGRTEARARAVQAWLGQLRAADHAEFAGIPAPQRFPIRLTFGGRALTGPNVRERSGLSQGTLSANSGDGRAGPED
ncbi:hypothetical protein Deima_1073 [Deinococcus maricopensis DSM 21211]|uniref:Uncharacterized protein n=1 Tax=Deinococcus maricopensis (strain DSM 21211 / LMG 22137 / NRRL B-23946 / LB-34) TaxID=709986 RepID=E8U6N7_DEIML|nr:hypothetical protein Deima_1073 [Deinococcus maricopensis DSM 21211]